MFRYQIDCLLMHFFKTGPKIYRAFFGFRNNCKVGE